MRRRTAISASWRIGYKDHPDDYIVRSHVALTYHSTGRSDDAIEAYRAIIEESSCLADRNFVVYTTSLLFLGRTLMRERLYDEALEAMQKALEMDPDYILTKLSLAEVYIRRENFAMALTFAGQVVDDDRQLTFFPIDYNEILYSARVTRAEAYFGLGNVKEAIVEYESAAEVPTPRRTDALGSLSNLLKAVGETDRALEVLRRAVEEAPENQQHLFNLGVLYLDRRDFEKAEGYFNDVLARSPDNPRALLNLGFIAKTSGRLEEAESIYRRVAAADGEEIEARANLAHLLLDQERFAEAAVAFAQVRDRDDSLLDINLGFLATLAQKQDWAGFAATAPSVLSLLAELRRQSGDLDSPADACATAVRLGTWLLEQNQQKCAELAFAAAVYLDGSNHEARHQLGEAFRILGQYWQAIAQFEAILLADPRDGEAFQRLGDCYLQLGVGDAAQLAYAKSAEVKGD